MLLSMLGQYAITLLAALSLLLFLAVIVLWVRSHYIGDRIVWAPGSKLSFQAITYPGAMTLATVSLPAGSNNKFAVGFDHDTVVPSVSPRASFSAFDYGTTIMPGFRSDHVFFPMWFVAVMCAILPPVWLVARRRWKRRARWRRGLCVACGYDLRASQDRCPECGKSIPATHADHGVNEPG